MRYVIVLTLLLLPVGAGESAVGSWGYQLQNFDIDKLVSSNYDLLVIDYSKDGSDAERFTLEEISDIKNSGKVVISYISIGEAEDYRYYFQEEWKNSPPDWLGKENPNWEGNFKVKFWMNEWQEIVYDYLDQILAAGFDGVYLDIIDAYEYWQEEYPDSRDLMIEFVGNISEYVKRAENHLVFPQNGEELLEEEGYRSVIDGIGKEDLYIDYPNRKQDSESVELAESYLDLLVNDGKMVLCVDYTDNLNLVEYARTSARTKGYISYIGPIELDELWEPNYTGRRTLDIPLMTVAIVVLLVCKRKF